MTSTAPAPVTAPASAFPPASYPIGTPGQPWGPAELAQWRARQVRQRSYAHDVLAVVDALRDRFDVRSYGEVAYADDRYALQCIRPRQWAQGRPTVLVTGGVHGYETSGVLGALRFVQQHGDRYADSVNWLVAPLRQPLGLGAHPALEPRRHGPQPQLPPRHHRARGRRAAGTDRAAPRPVCRPHRPARNH